MKSEFRGLKGDFAPATLILTFLLNDTKNK